MKYLYTLVLSAAISTSAFAQTRDQIRVVVNGYTVDDPTTRI